MPRPEYRNRQFNIIFPSALDLDEWQDEAKKCGVSLGKYLLIMAEKGKSIDTAPRLDLIRETDQSREELVRLRRDLKDKSAAIEKLETDLFRLRHQSVIDPGQAHWCEDLTNLLKGGRVWRGADLLNELGIDPMNTHALNIVARHLQDLQDLGLVSEGQKGWKWTE